MVHAAVRSALSGDIARSAIAGVLEPAQRDLAAPIRGGDRSAAVLIPWIEGPGGPSILFTVRAASLSRHPGEISFPGGMRDPGESLLEAALREAREEIGLDAQAVEVLGTLPPTRVPVSDVVVLPFVAAVAGPPTLALAEAEIAEVFTAKVAALALAGHRCVPAGSADGRRRWSFSVGDHVIWGATGAMLQALLERLGMLDEPARLDERNPRPTMRQEGST